MRECHVAVSLVIPAGKLESSAMEGNAAVTRGADTKPSPTLPGLGPGFPAGTTGDGGPDGGAACEDFTAMFWGFSQSLGRGLVSDMKGR